MDVEHARVGERAIAAGAAIRRETQMVRVLGPDDAGIVDAQEQRGAGKCRALRDQGLRERLRLRASLADDDSVARTDHAREIDAHQGDATIRRFRGWRTGCSTRMRWMCCFALPARTTDSPGL